MNLLLELMNLFINDGHSLLMVEFLFTQSGALPTISRHFFQQSQHLLARRPRQTRPPSEFEEVGNGELELNLGRVIFASKDIQELSKVLCQWFSLGMFDLDHLKRVDQHGEKFDDEISGDLLVPRLMLSVLFPSQSLPAVALVFGNSS